MLDNLLTSFRDISFIFSIQFPPKSMSEFEDLSIPEETLHNAVTASLIDLLDYNVIILTRSDKYYVGVLRYIYQT